MATSTSLGFTITSRYNGDGTTRARISLTQLDDQARKTNKSTESLGESMGGVLKRAALALAPALVPVAGGIVGVAGAATAMAVEVGAAGGVLAGLALTAARNAKTMGSAGQAYTSSLGGVRGAWMGLTRETAKDTLGPMTSALNGAAKAIPKLLPLVKALSPTVAKLGADVGNWLSGPGFQRSIDLITRYGVPAFNHLVAAGRSVVAVGGQAFRAFAPFGTTIAQAIQTGANKLKGWADAGGFQKFLKYVQSNSGNLKGFFSSLASLAQNLAITFGKMGPSSLSVMTTISKIVSKWPAPVIMGIASAWLAISAAMKANAIYTALFKAAEGEASLAMKVATAAQWLWNAAMDANPISLIIIGIAALVVAVIWIATKTTWFQTAWKAAWGGIKTAASAVWNFIRNDVFKPLGTFFTKTIPDAMDRLVSFFKGLPKRITSATKGMWDGIKNAFKAAINWVIGKWNALSFHIGGQKVFGVTLPAVTIGTPNIPYLARGGLVTGPGTGTSDSIHAMLSHGEFVMRAAAVNRLGVGTLNALNTGATTWAAGSESPARSMAYSGRTPTGGGGITVNINGPVYGSGTRRQFTDLILTSMRDLKRDGRTV